MSTDGDYYIEAEPCRLCEDDGYVVGSWTRDGVIFVPCPACDPDNEENEY